MDEKNTFQKLTEKQRELITIGLKEGLLEIKGKKIHYLKQKKAYVFTDPEEAVRASTYVELVIKYNYPPKRIDFEILPPRREPKLPADIVVYKDDEKEKPFIVVECKATSRKTDIEVAKREGLGNANLLLSEWLFIVCGEEEAIYYVKDRPPLKKLEEFRKAELPIAYGKAPKYKYKKSGGLFEELRRADLNELHNKFQRCHDAIWEGGKRDPAEAFDEMSKLMFAKIYDEKFTKVGEYYKFQVGSHEDPYIVAKRVKKLYEEAREKEPEVFREKIKLTDDIIFEVVGILQDVSLTKSDLDAKGRAFEKFLGKVFRGELGQFFTPREIIEFMVKFVDVDYKELVIDPACGSGGFLLYSIKHVMEKAIKEYGAEATKEIVWNFSHSNIFGIEVNDRIARIAMMDMVIHDDGHTNIECNDALLPYDNFDPRRDIRPSKYHVVLTNPPFGSREKRKEILKNFNLGKTLQGKVRKSQRKEILFIERCLDLLRPGGKMGIVLPDGILNNLKDAYVREYILKNAKVIGIISLPVFTFVPFGSGMKTSLVFLQKSKKNEKIDWGEYTIFMATAENIGYDSTGREIKNNDLLNILRAFREDFKFDRAMFIKPKDFVKRLKVDKLKKTFNLTRLDPEYYFLTLMADSLLNRCPYELKTLKEITDVITSGSRPGGRAEYIEGEVPSLEGGNISGDGRLIMENVKFIPLEFHLKHKKSAVRPLDILMVKDGATTGKVAIVPPDFPYKECNINEHLFIIRVKESYNPWYVFGFLLSDLGQILVKREITGGAQGGIAKNSIKKIIVPIPSKPVQDKIEKRVKKTLSMVIEKEQEIKQVVNGLKKWTSDILSSPQTQRKEEQIISIYDDDY